MSSNCDNCKVLEARLQTAERELATEKAKSEAFATVAAEAKERIEVVEGERDAALKAGRVLVAANTRHFNEAREACEALQAAQRENGVLRGALENIEGSDPDQVDAVALRIIARAALSGEAKPTWQRECKGCVVSPTLVRYADDCLVHGKNRPPSPKCDTTKGPCACGAWHEAAPVQGEALEETLMTLAHARHTMIEIVQDEKATGGVIRQRLRNYLKDSGCTDVPPAPPTSACPRPHGLLLKGEYCSTCGYLGGR